MAAPREGEMNMGKLVRRLLAVALVLILALGGLSFATAEDDWQVFLREMFGLTDDDQSGQQSDGQNQTGGENHVAITDPQQIVNYLNSHNGQLPENFITKREAQALGWDSYYNYLGEVAPGKSIGGDHYGNYERKLPTKKGRTWRECDVNYKGEKRGAERLVFSSDGLYYYTNDHYKTFIQMFPEG